MQRKRSEYADTPASVTRMRYATPAELRRMAILRESLQLSQRTLAHALYTPLRTLQQWESGKGQMHRLIWQAAMALLEAAGERSHREASDQAQRTALGLAPVEP